ncbi:uncharacterized protein METZ01_LOCUS443945, partial [marine metagenome]
MENLKRKPNTIPETPKEVPQGKKLAILLFLKFFSISDRNQC